jgi:hypothetical protein
MKDYVFQVIGSLDDVIFVESKAKGSEHFIGIIPCTKMTSYHFMLN